MTTATVDKTTDREPPIARTASSLTNDPQPSPVPARESIEVRALIYYRGFDDLEDGGIDMSKIPL